MSDNNLIKKETILRLPSWIRFPISKASEFEKYKHSSKNQIFILFVKKQDVQIEQNVMPHEQPLSYWVDRYVLVLVLFVR